MFSYDSHQQEEFTQIMNLQLNQLANIHQDDNVVNENQHFISNSYILESVWNEFKDVPKDSPPLYEQGIFYNDTFLPEISNYATSNNPMTYLESEKLFSNDDVNMENYRSRTISENSSPGELSTLSSAPFDSNLASNFPDIILSSNDIAINSFDTPVDNPGFDNYQQYLTDISQLNSSQSFPNFQAPITHFSCTPLSSTAQKSLCSDISSNSIKLETTKPESSTFETSPIPCEESQKLDYNGRKQRQWKNRKYKCSHCDLVFFDHELSTYATHIIKIEKKGGLEASGRRFKCTEPSCHWSKIGFVRKLEQQKHFTRKHGNPTFECRFWKPGKKEKYKGSRVCNTRWHADSGNRLRHERSVHRAVWSTLMEEGLSKKKLA